MNSRHHHLSRKTAGFTLVEIMIVVAIIGLLVAIAVPNFQRARKRSQASRILSDLRIVDYALDRWAIENNKSGQATATFEDLRPFLKRGSQLYVTETDVLGGIIGPGIVVDVGPRLPDSTWEALSDVTPGDFWSPYR